MTCFSLGTSIILVLLNESTESNAANLPGGSEEVVHIDVIYRVIVSSLQHVNNFRES